MKLATGLAFALFPLAACEGQPDRESGSPAPGPEAYGKSFAAAASWYVERSSPETSYASSRITTMDEHGARAWSIETDAHTLVKVDRFTCLG
jgi:hypothetical protein